MAMYQAGPATPGYQAGAAAPAKRNGCVTVGLGYLLLNLIVVGMFVPAGMVSMIGHSFLLFLGIILVLVGVGIVRGKTAWAVTPHLGYHPSVKSPYFEFGLAAFAFALAIYGREQDPEILLEKKKAAEALELAKDSDGDGVADVRDCAPQAAADAKDKALDADCDGAPDKVDCQPKSDKVRTTSVEDSDCDGVTNTDDCSVNDALTSVSKASDTDCDGLPNITDCNPNGAVDDHDCDGITNSDDCAPSDGKVVYRKSVDKDCDGVDDADDCNETVADQSLPRPKDLDCDSLPNETDCDPTGHPKDDDCDEVLNDEDCGPADAKMKINRSTDGDCDGILNDNDCAPGDSGNDTLECRMPKAQLKFCEEVTDARQRYSSLVREGANEIAVSGVRHARGRALRSAVPGGRVKNWIGTISQIETSMTEGKGMITIELSCDAELKTWNNFISDTFDKTMIAANSRVFRQLASIQEGQTVMVSGELVSDSTGLDGFRSADVSEGGAVLATPEFIMRFTNVSEP